MSMRALVTGANGFVGKHLVPALEVEGYAVATLSVRERGELVGDVLAVAGMLGEFAPDVVFHLAGMMHAPFAAPYYRINVLWTATVLDALAHAGLGEVPFLAMGAAAEYGLVDEQEPIPEDRPEQPVGFYGHSKLAATKLCLDWAARGRPIVVARPTNILGPGMPSYFTIANFAEQLAAIEKGEQPSIIDVGNLASARDFVDVRDVVRILPRLVSNREAHGKIVNIGTGRAVTLESALDELIRQFGVKVEIRKDPGRYRAGDVSTFSASTTRLANLAGPLEFHELPATLATVVAHARLS